MDTIITSEDQARLDAALDQLFAAISDVELGEPVSIGKPVILLVTLKNAPGFAYFSQGFDTDEQVAMTLRRTADRIAQRPPDQVAESTEGDT